MSILNVPHYSHNDLHGGIAAHLGNALRAVAAALIAKPAAKPAAEMIAAPKKANLAALFRLAGGYESVSPALAAELRYIGRR